VKDAAVWKDDDRRGLAQLIALEHANPAYDRAVTDFLNVGELAEEAAETAVLGIVPCIAFCIAAFEPDGLQERILGAIRDDDGAPQERRGRDVTRTAHHTDDRPQRRTAQRTVRGLGERGGSCNRNPLAVSTGRGQTAPVQGDIQEAC
jgi:hypothetical protein